MKLNKLSVVFCIVVMLLASGDISVLCEEEELIKMTTAKPLLGGVHDCRGSQNSAEIESLARFAVQEHNKHENTLLEFARVLKAKEQVVAGKMYHLTLEAIDAGKKKIYEAKVWVKPWMNFKELQEFKHAGEVPSFTSSDLGVKRDCTNQMWDLFSTERGRMYVVKSDSHGLGWREISTHDPTVQDAADHAVKTIQRRSNSLFPYELLDILKAKAEVIENFVKLDLLLKVKRGIKEEKFKVEVRRNIEGNYYLNQMEQDHS